ncbi:hypothetical protein [Tsukamurella hominis]|uniref:hypothetical protein n=1 Tax=Tsukamurella hominis TaxID=1970232 RepID=UPI0039EBC5B5
MSTTDRPSYARTGDWQARTAHWRPLTSWAAGDQPWEEAPETVHGLLGVEPQDRYDHLELLHLALLAVSLDRRRLEAEFAARAPLDPQRDDIDAAELARYQADLTFNSLGSADHLHLFEAALAAKITACGDEDLREGLRWMPERPGIEQTPRARAVAWSAALRFGLLSQDLALLLDLPPVITFRRFLLASAGRTARPNAVACYNEPWRAGSTRALQRQNTHGDLVFELTVPPSAIVTIAHAEPRRDQVRRHPARETGEAGHPLVAAIAPIDVEHVLAGEYLRELPAPQWRPITL